MRPLKLTMAGLRSYQAPTTIDFTDLTLFALIGDTGAGKSSIIEALCLALYNGTTWSGRGVTELMSDASDRMAVELVFGAEGDTWTVTRSHRRAGGPSIHKLISSTGEKVDGAEPVNRKIQELLGLTKDQFLRAVVMPQGQFEKLLRATAGERTDILKGIFRLQALDQIRNEAGSLIARWRGPVSELHGERGTLPPDPAAAVTAARRAHDDAVLAAQTLSDQAEKAAAAERAAQEATSTASRLGELRGRVVSQLDEISVNEVEGLCATSDALDARQADLEATRAAAEEAALAADEAAAGSLGGFADRDAAVTAAARLRQAAQTITTEGRTLTSASEALTALDASPPAAELDPDIAGAESAARTALAAAEAELRAAETALDVAKRAYSDWADACTQHTAALATQDAANAELLTTREAVAEHTRELDAATASAAGAREAREAAIRLHAAAVAAADCEPGDDCPVCTQTLPAGFESPAAPDLDAAAADLAEADRALHRAREVHQAAALAEGTAASRAESAATGLAAARERADTARGVLATSIGTEVPDDLAETAALAALTQRVDDRMAAVDRASKGHQEASAAASQALSTLAAQRSQWETKRASHSDSLDDAKTAIAGARSQLDALPPRWSPNVDATPDAIETTASDIDAALTTHTDHQTHAAAHRRAVSEAEADLLRLATERTTSVTQPRDTIVNAAKRTHATLLELASLLGDPASSVPTCPSPGDPLPTIADLVAKLLAVGATITSTASGREEGLAEDAEARTAELVTALTDAGAADTTALATLCGAANANAQHAKTALEQTETSAARAEQLDAVLAVAAPFLAALEALRAALADGKFVGHLVREREVALLAEASRVLRRVSEDRFGFADGFKVIDRRSGRERSPDTLSGGERFQASLALALALVEIATRSGGQLEAVFVDEGFGSLDAGALDQALSTLGGVASDGKLVALVSHLRQVAEHVDQVLLVERDPATGSKVQVLDQAERDALLAEDARSRMTA